MKPRRVFITMEVETDIPLGVLRTADAWIGSGASILSGRVFFLYQVQANVARPESKKKRVKR